MPQSLKGSSQNGRFSAPKVSPVRNFPKQARAAKSGITGRGITTEVSTSTKSTSKF